jgi:hypothetical protein
MRSVAHTLNYKISKEDQAHVEQVIKEREQEY